MPEDGARACGLLAAVDDAAQLEADDIASSIIDDLGVAAVARLSAATGDLTGVPVRAGDPAAPPPDVHAVAG